MEFRVPELGEGVYEAELVSWLVKPGDAVMRGQNLMEVLTDKATMEVPAPFVGTVTALRAAPGQHVKVGDVVLDYAAAGQPVEAPRPGPASVPPPAPDRARRDSDGADPAGAGGNGRSVKAAPSVRFMARKLGVNLAAVAGSGPEGRVLLGDLSAHVGRRLRAAGRPGAPAPVVDESPTPAADYGTPGTRLKLQGLRRKIAEHMVQSKRAAPHYAYVDECDVTRLVQLRDDLRGPAEAAGVRLTYLAFFVRAAARALREVPLVNASLDEAAGEIILHDACHVGVAVATPAGLVVPVVRDADRKDLLALAGELDRLSAEARAGKSRLEDLRGSTFTVTSIGNVGGLISTPIINQPNVGIMGVGKIVRRPVYDGSGAIRPADVVYLSFSFDHRVVDGAVGAAFGNAVRRLLEHPGGLALPVPS
jgi:pyruvate dehydrogenase E2 component (dihydrolipoamide acetyltransferase)/2-oxoisovalerate dehydrogenase E2 component (dihydrolipoyl transacylase)